MSHSNTLMNKFRFPRLFALGCGALFATALFAGCGDEPVFDDDAKEATYTQTSLRRDSAGNLVTSTRTITASEQQALNARRAGAQAQDGSDYDTRQQGLNADPYCQGNDMWLYDGLNGTGNMLCLAGEGVADLNQYRIGRNDCVYGNCAPLWTAQVRSIWPGVDGSWFSNDYTGQSPNTCWRYFNKWGPLTNADSCVSISRYIGLYVAY